MPKFFFLVMKTFKIYYVNNFKIYNRVLSIAMMLYIISPELTYFITRSLYLLTTFTYSYPHSPTTSGNHHNKFLDFIKTSYLLTTLTSCLSTPSRYHYSSYATQISQSIIIFTSFQIPSTCLSSTPIIFNAENSTL